MSALTWAPAWAREAIEEHYDRIAEGIEDDPQAGLVDMLLDAYERGLTDARAVIEVAEEKLRREIAEAVMPEVVDKGRVLTGVKTARGLVLALERGDKPYWREIAKAKGEAS